jgi:hypothetical protein
MGMMPEHFNIENVEMLWRRAPPPAPQAQAKLASAVATKELRMKTAAMFRRKAP